MNIGLLYLGIILLLGGCFLYVRYNLKNINLRITTLMELTTALTNELELIQKNMGLTNNNNSSSNIIDSINNVVHYDNRELVSDDEDDEDEDDDDDDDDDEEDNDEVLEIKEFVIESTKSDIDSNIIKDDEYKNIEILELDHQNKDYDKLTVPELKKMVKDKNPEVSVTKLKKDELILLLNNN
tara:strand:- start:32 stop:580 length:549 start_codon:yes stop_codon:yes gene_type:complete